jgi:hypothetical protein
MFSSSDDRRASDAIGHGNHSQPVANFADFLPQGETVTDIDLRLLPAGTRLSVNTRNSRYRLLMLDGSGCHALVQGGRYFCEETDADIVGATFDGSSRRVGWICSGLGLEVSVRGKRIVTSRVRAINVESLGS